MATRKSVIHSVQQSKFPKTIPPPTFQEALQTMLGERCPYDKEGRTWAVAISFALCKRAVRGDVQAATEIFDRVEGS